MSESLHAEHDHVPDQLVEQLAKGYDALAIEIKLLNEQRRDLENRLSWAKQQYLDSLKRFVPDSASQDFRTFLGELDEAAATEKEGDSGWLESLLNSSDAGRRNRAYDVQRAGDAREKVRYRKRSVDGGYGVKIWGGKSADGPDSGFGLEQDYTTAGKPGNLRCPFATNTNLKTPSTSGHRGISTPRSSVSRMSLRGRRSKRASFHDPIRAEICSNDMAPSSAAPSADGSVPLCPIRFLDQHSPEEVAAYFEKHKHELPRSHEVCVKRYQSNEQQVRQLDAKYGSLVSMIQGLGMKHQPMLPESPAEEDEDAVEDSPSNDKIQDWAKAVTVSLEKVVPDVTPTRDLKAEEERESRFDRPMKEVRLGESPSRPWGIQVPEDFETRSSSSSVKSEHVPAPNALSDTSPTVPHSMDLKAGKCPFSQMHAQKTVPQMVQQQQQQQQQQQEQEHCSGPPRNPTVADRARQDTRPVMINVGDQACKTEVATETPRSLSPSMVFTGPVFIGYSMEQVRELLKQNGAWS